MSIISYKYMIQQVNLIIGRYYTWHHLKRRYKWRKLRSYTSLAHCVDLRVDFYNGCYSCCLFKLTLYLLMATLFCDKVVSIEDDIMWFVLRFQNMFFLNLKKLVCSTTININKSTSHCCWKRFCLARISKQLFQQWFFTICSKA